MKEARVQAYLIPSSDPTSANISPTIGEPGPGSPGFDGSARHPGGHRGRKSGLWTDSTGTSSKPSGRWRAVKLSSTAWGERGPHCAGNSCSLPPESRRPWAWTAWSPPPASCWIWRLSLWSGRSASGQWTSSPPSGKAVPPSPKPCLSAGGEIRRPFRRREDRPGPRLSPGRTAPAPWWSPGWTAWPGSSTCGPLTWRTIPPFVAYALLTQEEAAVCVNSSRISPEAPRLPGEKKRVAIRPYEGILEGVAAISKPHRHAGQRGRCQLPAVPCHGGKTLT